MAGTAVTPASLAGISPNAAIGGGGLPKNDVSPSGLNSYRISAVIDHLQLNVQGNRPNDAFDFLNLYLSLARGIDFAIANNEVPSRSQELPLLLKQVCQNRNDTLLQAAIMVLMISAKSACRSGWFSNGDTEELNNLAKEVANTFGSMPDLKTVPSCSSSIISEIMLRFYPRMKMGHIFTFLEVKPGFDAYVADFQILKNLKPSPGEKIRLFIVQTDNIETSSCLISPPKVNFLVNGKGVERRTNIFVDTGPQIPTIIMHFLKYGSNLLQAVGEFNGHYIIAVAFMSEMPNPDSSALPDYDPHATATVDSDSEIIEGPSRISLNCPISRQRIQTPVKGCSCNHIQCFDFNNYVNINLRRPSWRCPSCNQHVCFTDMRIDQKMVKVLQEVGPDVSDIIMSSDGSWKAVTESDDTTEKPKEDMMSMALNESVEPDDVVDLTWTDDAMDTALCGTEDTKQSMDADEHQFMIQNTTVNPNLANRGNDISNGSGPGGSVPTVGLLGPSNIEPNAQIAGVSVPTSVSADSFTFPNPEVEAFRGDILFPNPVSRGETSLRNAVQLQQQQQLGNPSMINEYGRFPLLARNVMRTPSAVQALAVPTPNTVIQQTSRNSVDTLIPSNFSAASQASPAAPNISTALAAQTPAPVLLQSSRNSMSSFTPTKFSAALQANPAAPNISTALPAQTPTPVINQSNRNSANAYIPNNLPPTSQSSPAGPNTSTPLRTNPRHVSPVSLPTLHQQHVQFPPTRSNFQNASFQNPSHAPNAYRVSNERHASSQHMANLRRLLPKNQQSPGQLQSSMLSSRSFLPPQSHASIPLDIAVSIAGVPISQQVQLMAAANRTAHMAVDASRASPSFVRNHEMSVMPTGDQRINFGGASQPIPRTDSSDPSDMSWRPTARMRGALTGQAYLDALNQFIIRPGQQAQAARPVSNMTSLPADAQVPMAGNQPSAGTANGPSGSNPCPNPHLG